jgi:hypothetical protein
LIALKNVNRGFKAGSLLRDSYGDISDLLRKPKSMFSHGGVCIMTCPLGDDKEYMQAHQLVKTEPNIAENTAQKTMQVILEFQKGDTL